MVNFYWVPAFSLCNTMIGVGFLPRCLGSLFHGLHRWVCSNLYIYLVLFCSLSHVRVSKLVSVCVSDWSCTKIGDALVGSLNTTVLLCYTLSALLGSLYFWKFDA